VRGVAETLPLFPLCTVLLPGASLPLHIFEPRYRQLIVDLINGKVPDRAFGTIAVRSGWDTDVTRVDQMAEFGCSAVLREARKLPDGRFNIVTRGERRFRLLDVDASSAPYLVASVEWIPDEEMAEDVTSAMPELMATAHLAHRRYCSAAWHREDWVELGNDTEPATLANLMAADCLLPASDRQQLLEELCPAKRLQLVRRMLNRETGILRKLRAIPAGLSDLGERASVN
jgi:Lon protease-like protein